MINLTFTGQPISQTVYWDGSDSEELFKQNLKDPKKRNLLETFGWINTPIEYTFNSCGFRSIEFDANDNGFITLGCSFTSGVGLHLWQIWPELLSKKLNQPVWNLGVGGASLDTVYRLAEHYIPGLKPSKVILLAPEWTRIELWDDECVPRVLNHHAEWGYNRAFFDNAYMKSWLTNDANVHYHGIKNIYSIAYICHILGIELYCYDAQRDFMQMQKTGGDQGRDLMHNGPSCHEEFANMVYSDITQKKVHQPSFVI